MRTRLLTAYDALAEKHGHAPAPDWGEPLAAPIPFIGAHYGALPGAPRLLVYASAENLVTARDDNAPWWSERTGLRARDRHHIAWTKGWTISESEDVKPETRIGYDAAVACVAPSTVRGGASESGEVVTPRC